MYLNSIVTGIAIYSAVAHAANTFPTPKNVYLRWLVGLIQYAVANYKEGAAALRGPQ